MSRFEGAASTPAGDPNQQMAALLATALSIATAALESGNHDSKQNSRPAAAPAATGPALISIPEAARELGLSRASAYRYAAEGKLPVKRFGRRVYIVRAQLADFVNADPTDSAEADAA